MNDERLYQIILNPVISEKSTMAAERGNQVVFKVRADAAKDEIRAAVEKLFEVEVTHVRTANVRGKVKRLGRTPGQRSDWKKAYISLKEGHDIDFLDQAGA